MANDPSAILDTLFESDQCIDLTDSSPVLTTVKLAYPFAHTPRRTTKRKLEAFLEHHNTTDNVIYDISSDEDEINEEEEERRRAIKRLHFPLDNVFRKSLKLHQVEGLAFMWKRVYEKRQGCLLAHSMGLGKTIQVISLLTTLYQQLKRDPESNFPAGKRVLVLAPLVTLANWENEFSKWAVNLVDNVIGEVYNLTNIKHFGDTRLRFLKHWYAQGGIMLLNYEAFRALLTVKDLNDRDRFYKYLVNPGPNVVILDEAHRIKNASSLVSAHVQNIQTRSRICMTGYPLQNHLSEYYFMLDFIAPGILGTKDDYHAYFRLYIEKCFLDSSATIKQQAAFKMYVLQLMTNHVTHRRDESVLQKDLPKKTEYVIRFKLSPVQLRGYNAILDSNQVHSALVGLTILRSMCNHPKIFQNFILKRYEKQRVKDLGNHSTLDEEQDELAEEYDDIIEENEEAAFDKWAKADFEWTKDYLENADIESWKCSGKMSFIIDLLNECKLSGEKVAIVSHSLACLDYIQGLLPVFGIKEKRLDGSVQAMERQNIIDAFNDEPEYGVILLSAKASAIGINLTAANRIILVDQDWNPLYDEQSIGRVYRYGQTKPVIVYRLTTATTIEERIHAQSIHKRSISRRVIDNRPSNVISRDELIHYFMHPDAHLAMMDMYDLPEDMDIVSKGAILLNRTHITGCIALKEAQQVLDKDQVLTKHAREKAQLEATGLLKVWRTKHRF